LYNRDAMLLYSIDGWRKPADEVVLSMMGCYKALHRAHVPVDFLDTSELEAGSASRYRVLYLPYSYALSAKSCDAIRTFVRNGGTVWADGLIGWKNEEGVTKQFPPGPLSDVFGFTVQEIEPRWDPFELQPGDGNTGELWRCAIPGGGGFKEHSFGKGRAIYYGTALTLGYLRRENAAAARWIASPAITSAAVSIEPSHIGLRVLTHPSGYLAILTNWGPTAALQMKVPSGASVTNLITGQRGVPESLAAADSAVLRIDTPGTSSNAK
jgi:hypothetical protein